MNDTSNQSPSQEFSVGDIVRITSHDSDDQNGIHVISGLRLTFFNYFRIHLWEYLLVDHFSPSGWFEESALEKAEAQTDDERYYISGGEVPFRDLVKCQSCKKMRVDDDFDCPYCASEK